MAEALQIASAAVSLVDVAARTAVLVKRVLRDSTTEALALETRLQALAVLVKAITKDLDDLARLQAEEQISEAEINDLRRIKELIEQCTVPLESLKKSLEGVQKHLHGRLTIRLSRLPAHLRLVFESGTHARHLDTINQNIQNIIVWYQLLQRHERQRNDSVPQVVNNNTNQTVVINNIIIYDGRRPSDTTPAIEVTDYEPQSARRRASSSTSQRLLEPRAFDASELDTIIQTLSSQFQPRSSQDDQHEHHRRITSPRVLTDEILLEEPHWDQSPTEAEGSYASHGRRESGQDSRSPLSTPSPSPTALDYDSPLWKAIRRNDDDLIRQCLEEGQNIQIRNAGYHQTPLIYAAHNLAYEAVVAILEKCTPLPPSMLNAKDSDGKTALIEVSTQSGEECAMKIASVLLEHHCDVLCVDSAGRSALHWATSHSPDSAGHRQRFYNMLIEHGAQFDTVQTSQRTLERYKHGQVAAERAAEAVKSRRRRASGSLMRRRTNEQSPARQRSSNSSNRDSADDSSMSSSPHHLSRGPG